MPIAAPVISALISGGTQIGSGVMQGIQNRAQRKWNEKMYDRQRTDALSDWNMQNEYNNPLNQMARLKDAGLNPNLVYGNGAQATSGQMPRQTDVKSWTPQAPQFNGNAVLSSYYDTQVKQAQIDNMKVQNTVLQREAALKEVETLNKIISGKRSQFDLDLKSDLRQTSIDIVKENLRKLTQGIDQSEGRYNWEVSMNIDKQAGMQIRNDIDRWRRDTENPLIIKKMLQSMVNMRKQVEAMDEGINRSIQGRIQSEQETKRIEQSIQNMATDGRLKLLQEQLKKLGIDAGDETIVKMLGMFLSNL